MNVDHDDQNNGKPILVVEDLKLHFLLPSGTVQALKGVDLEIRRGETIGLVGETGCGKSVFALAVMGLIPFPGRIVSGRILFDGIDLREKSPEEMREFRKNKISMVFQDPNAYLDPVLTIYEQVSESIATANRIEMGRSIGLFNVIGPSYHSRNFDSAQAIKEFLREATVAALKQAKMPSPERTMESYPHELSGGMKQRSMIAMAISKKPALLVLDEATTALDVTTQAQILELLRELKKDLNTTVLMITHDLGVASEVCDKVVIMYAGEIVETGVTSRVLSEPLHPYTQGLLRAIPRRALRGKVLEDIPGQLPNVSNPPPGCLFAPRCRSAWDKCSTSHPRLLRKSEDSSVRCYLYGE
jgi:oligopeptide/dipeptide ABC transporter ATP-binding protein